MWAAATGRWAPFVYAVSIILAVIGGIWYTDRTARESERKWCEFITVLDDAWSSSPPQSQLGRAVAGSLHKLRSDFDC